MDEEDLDFAPAVGTGSKLASLFAPINSLESGNSSLTYTAPKQPKKEASPSKSVEAKSSTKLNVIVTKVVHAFKLENGSYVPQSKLGITIVGNHLVQTYQIILYTGSKDHLSKTKLAVDYTVTVSANNYISFYDDEQKNWSVMFQSFKDMFEFCCHLVVSKLNCCKVPVTQMLTQDIVLSEVQSAKTGSVLDVKVTVFTVMEDKYSELSVEVLKDVRLDAKVSWTEGLVGCGEGSIKLLVLPHALSAPWTSQLAATACVLLLVEITKVTVVPSTEVVQKSSSDVCDSPVDSSEESSVKARGASIREALSTSKTQKASLISRMARMGQATLPLNRVAASDSEEESSVPVSPKPTRVTRSKPGYSDVSVYQTAPQDLWLHQQHHQHMMRSGAYTQLVPVPASTMTSPTTDGLNVYMSESRTQATELRMGVAKVSDKVDQVLTKLQDLDLRQSQTTATLSTTALDPAGLLASVQALVTDNNNLKQKTDEQNKKIEQQSDRIYSLLELNHKYLEESTNSKGKVSENETNLLSQLASYKTKELELNLNLEKTLQRLTSLEEELSTLKRHSAELQTEGDNLKSELDRVKGADQASLVESKNLLQKQVDEAQRLKCIMEEKLANVKKENEKLLKDIETQRLALESEKSECETLMRGLEEVKKQSKSSKTDDLDGSKVRVEKLESLIQQLEEEKAVMVKQIESLSGSKQTSDDTVEEVKRVMNAVYRTLQPEFEPAATYTGVSIRQVLATTIRDVTLQLLQHKQIVNSNSATETSRPDEKKKETQVDEKEEGKKNNQDNTAKNDLDNSLKKEEVKKKDDDDKKDELSNVVNDSVTSQHTSYDQGWRPSKPPPLPLFDDEDDEDSNWLV